MSKMWNTNLLARSDVEAGGEKEAVDENEKRVLAKTQRGVAEDRTQAGQRVLSLFCSIGVWGTGSCYQKTRLSGA